MRLNNKNERGPSTSHIGSILKTKVEYNIRTCFTYFFLILKNTLNIFRKMDFAISELIFDKCCSGENVKLKIYKIIYKH